MQGAHRPRFWVSVVVVVALAAGCSRALDRGRLEDARLAVRVKTVLVNDTDVGAFPIEVRVTAGVVRLSGRLDTDAQRARALDLARSVDGVRDVESSLVVGGSGSPSVEPGGAIGDLELPDEGGDGDRRLLAVGVSAGWAVPPASTLESSLSAGPLVRLGSGAGLGTTIGFGWYNTDVYGDGEGRLGTLTVRPLMAGLGYTARGGGTSASFSLVGGLALNGVEPDGRRASGSLALKAGNSLAVRPGVSIWFDLNSRLAFNIFAGHVITRPRMTFFEDGRITSRTVRADTSLLRMGLAYKLF